MLSNFDLEDISKTYNVPLVSVCMKDELPNKVVNGNYIINLESSTAGQGTHWCSLIIKNDDAYFQDSFGAPPSQEIINFIKKRKGCKLAFNNFIIQDLKSDFCGYYCIALLIYMKKHLTNSKSLIDVANNFVNGFFDDTKENNEILKSFFIENTNGTLIPLIKRMLRFKKFYL